MLSLYQRSYGQFRTARRTASRWGNLRHTTTITLPSMTQKQLIDQSAKRGGMTIKEMSRAYKLLTATMQDEILRGDGLVPLAGIGSIQRKETVNRRRYNVVAGKVVVTGVEVSIKLNKSKEIAKNLREEGKRCTKFYNRAHSKQVA